MGVHPDVVEVLQSVLAADPSNHEVRLQLSDVLLRAGNAAEALTHAVTVLVVDPVNFVALQLAEAAATAVGDFEQAEEWRKLLASLGRSVHPSAPDIVTFDVVEHEASLDVEISEQEIDAFLRDVLRDVEHVVTLRDVAGMTDVKEQLDRSFLLPMQHPQLREVYGKSLSGGLLLYGPPGCGKTFLARSLAGELGARFCSIEVHDVLDAWMGRSEKNLHAIFDTARQFEPAMLFFDEVDVLGFRRDNLAYSPQRNAVAQFLSELDGLSCRDDVFVLAATNQPWELDPAFLRPGRFDRAMLVLPPSEDARVALLQHHLAGRPVDAIDFAHLAAITDGYSGADLRMVCERAVEMAFRMATRAGDIVPLRDEHLIEALNGVESSVQSWFESAARHAADWQRNASYAGLLTYMRERDLM